MLPFPNNSGYCCRHVNDHEPVNRHGYFSWRAPAIQEFNGSTVPFTGTVNRYIVFNGAMQLLLPAVRLLLNTTNMEPEGASDKGNRIVYVILFKMIQPVSSYPLPDPITLEAFLLS